MKTTTSTMLRTAAAAIVFGLVSMQANASAMLNFETSLDDSSVSFNHVLSLGGPPTATLNSGLDDMTFSLAAGESYTFDFFTIHLPVSIGYGRIDATLGLIDPDVIAASGSGHGLWGSLRVASGGILHWTHQPGQFTDGNGGLFDVSFSNLAGIQLGNSATVKATVTALATDAQTTAVPEPGTLALLGIGLVGLGLARSSRRRR